MKITRLRTRQAPTSATRVCGPEGIPALERQIAHWEQEETNSRAQIAAGKHPQYDAACRRYIAECRATVRSIRREIQHWSAPSGRDRAGAK